MSGLFPEPKKECEDEKCPFHGNLSVRGQIFKGKVVSNKMKNTVVVNREYIRKDKKYKRFKVESSKISVHNPPCIDANVDDVVTIMETRPLSKTVHFVVVEKNP